MAEKWGCENSLSGLRPGRTELKRTIATCLLRLLSLVNNLSDTEFKNVAHERHFCIVLAYVMSRVCVNTLGIQQVLFALATARSRNVGNIDLGVLGGDPTRTVRELDCGM